MAEQKGKKTILVIDDVQMNLRTVQTILQDDYDVLIVRSCEDARKMFKTDKIDLVLLDIEMPGVSGLDFLSEIRVTFPKEKLPVLMITAYSSPQVFKIAMERGAQDYILKPFVPTTLKSKVSRIFGLYS